MNYDSIYALIIVAHPDDESFLFAGTTMKLQDEGKTVGLICATRGEKGKDRLERQLSQDEMAKIRTNELLAACKILNCDCKEIFDYPDGGLDQVDLNELTSKIAAQIDLYQPEIILTFGAEGVTGHRDHIAIGQAVMAAVKIANHKPAEVWRVCIPSSQIQNFLEHYEQKKIHYSHFTKQPLQGVPDDNLIRFDIRKYKETKLKALEAHKSQYVPNHNWPGFLEEECFEVIKLS